MKNIKKSFLHAVVIFSCLVVSWIALLIKSKINSSPAEPLLDETVETETVQREQPIPSKSKSHTSEVPEAWADWIQYLDGVNSPDEMRLALSELESAFNTLETDDIIERILEFLEGEYDYKTSLAFQLGLNQRVIGTPSLKSFLLDYLRRLSPKEAFAYSKQKLIQIKENGFSKSQNIPSSGELALYFQIYASNGDLQLEEISGFLSPFTKWMISEPRYMEELNSATAESFDAIVFLNQYELVDELMGLIQSPPSTAHLNASYLTLERLFLNEPEITAEFILRDATPASISHPEARSGLFARLDPDASSQRLLLENYLSSPLVSNEEQALFWKLFPNLNLTFSHNLLTENPQPRQGSLRSRLESALAYLESLIQSNSFPESNAQIEEAILRIEDTL